MAGATGKQTLTCFFHYVDRVWVGVVVHVKPTDARVAEWRTNVWNALYNSARSAYYDRQQEVATEIAAIEEQLANVDTLTLRREESDEIMKGVLRFLLGPGFEFMPKEVVDLIAKTTREVDDINYGVAFQYNELKLDSTELAIVRKYENVVRFINQAIEWENVITFLSSYFWDVPQGWDFIRQIRHSDPTRQAFLRAGSARAVLTIRKGWEEVWVHFYEGGSTDSIMLENSPYLTIAREIAAYDDRNGHCAGKSGSEGGTDARGSGNHIQGTT